MVKKLFILLFLIFVTIQANGNDQKRAQLLSVIDEELGEVTRLNKQINSRDPELLLRMAELLLEKARIIREAENQKYLSIPASKRRKISKSKFFKKSLAYFKQAQKTCVFILKRHKNFKNKGDVYYIMAYNAKEFGQNKKAESYFYKATKGSKKKSTTNRKSNIALADIYYNKRQYKKAIPLYERALTKKDKWWTKDAFNLAWCYFRENKRSKAISLMRDVYKYSKRDNYVDMSNLVERDLAYFYTQSGRVKEAVNFYKGLGKNVGDNLYKVGTTAMNAGRYTVAEQVLEESLKHIDNQNLKIRALTDLLPIYEKYGKTDKHLQVSKQLADYKKQGQLNKDQSDKLIYHVKRMSAILQKQVAAKSYKHNKKLREKKAKAAVEYFALTSQISGKENARSIFLAGETLYSYGDYDSAAEKYSNALDVAIKNGDKKYIKRSLDSLIASLAQRGISKKTLGRFLEKSYLYHIKYYSRSKKNEKIFQRLFNFYMEKEDLTNSEKTLVAYKNRYPRNIKTQEAMIAKIMDYYRNKNNKQQVISWVNRINSGEFKVTRKYANQVKKILLTMQFEKVESASSKGDKKKALAGYVSIYKDPSSSAEAKKNSAYNIAVLFHELGHANLTYKWSKNALDLMTTSDVVKFNPTFLLIANDLFNQQELSYSAEINQISFSKLCKRKVKNKKLFFKNATILYLADGNYQEARKVIAKGLRCRIKTKDIEQAQLDLMKTLTANQKWTELNREIDRIDVSKKYRPFLITFLEEYRLALMRSGRVSLANNVKKKIISYYGYSKRNRFNIPLEALDIVARFELEDVEAEYKRLFASKLQFPEKTFNSTLQQKFKQLDRVTTKSIAVMKIGSGIGIVGAYKYLDKSYNGLIKEITGFSPPGKSPEYVNSFKKSMNDIVAPLRRKVSEFNSQAKNQIYTDNILSKDNSWFLGAKLNVPFAVQHFPPRGGILMDRGGKR